ncbi:hypothetical protein RB195_003172 [Necator americanus]|uniref:Histone-lysine N-methyltransferase SETMAR n=1 Tax=Necator americanus TaxID=51031 RepID=A0ABR1DN51_NECAM
MKSTVSNAGQHDSYCRGLLRSTAKTGRQDPQGAIEARQQNSELGWKVLPHPPYSPDLAPSDYHLFRSVQHHLEEKRYNDCDHLENDLPAFFASKSPKFYAKGIRDLVRRWQKVVDVDGDYFVE